MTSILAIAIGDPANSRTITSQTQLHGVRPYITGLYNYLSKNTTFALGTAYTIDYQECWEGQENFTGTHGIIFCMSTPVVRTAKNFTATIPIVGIFSDPHGENFDTTNNICGVIGKRIQHARKYYDCFVDTVKPSQVYILHRDKNTASTACLNGITGGGALSVPITPLTLKTAPGNDPRPDIATLISTISGPSPGLLVLPVDVFFGTANFIFQQASALPVFWSAPDWCPPAVCAHGASQEECGELMGVQVAYSLANPGKIPLGAATRFVEVPEAHINCVASAAAAKALKIELRKHHHLQIIKG
jgi:hypothetical protein